LAITGADDDVLLRGLEQDILCKMKTAKLRRHFFVEEKEVNLIQIPDFAAIFIKY
jgi:hypothetical protein